MRAMVLRVLRQPLELEERPDPAPGPGEVRIRIEACAVCRTDLHLVDGALPSTRLPVVPGHEIVGIVECRGPGPGSLPVGTRVGVPWVARTCGQCAYCRVGRENLCDKPLFTGFGRDGGFASHVVANTSACLPVDLPLPPHQIAPLLCGGIIGWRTLRMAGDAKRLGIYGFGSAAHIVAQVAVHEGREIYAFTRSGDLQAQASARETGAVWAGSSEDAPPVPLDAALIFAPEGSLVPRALAAVRKGGRVVCGGIHMSDIPEFPYRLLWEERVLMSVANLTRADAAGLLHFAAQVPLRMKTTLYPLERANDALHDLRDGRLQGTAVLVP
jgi:propanol-preferring alcohol dehydrogenase